MATAKCPSRNHEIHGQLGELFAELQYCLISVRDHARSELARRMREIAPYVPFHRHTAPTFPSRREYLRRVVDLWAFDQKIVFVDMDQLLTCIDNIYALLAECNAEQRTFVLDFFDSIFTAHEV